MIFLDDMVVDIPVLEGKSLITHCACLIMESIVNSSIFLYSTECTVDLILSLWVMMFHPDVGLCSPDSCVCTLDGTRSAYIFLNSFSAWYSFTWKLLFVCGVTMACSLFRISFLTRPKHRLIVLYFTFPVIVVKYGCLLMKQKSIWSVNSGWCFKISDWMGICFLDSICLGFFLIIISFKIAVVVT